MVHTIRGETAITFHCDLTIQTNQQTNTHVTGQNAATHGCFHPPYLTKLLPLVSQLVELVGAEQPMVFLVGRGINHYLYRESEKVES